MVHILPVKLRTQRICWDISSFKHDWSKLINNKNNELDRLNKIYLNLLSKVTIINGFAKITEITRLR